MTTDLNTIVAVRPWALQSKVAAHAGQDGESLCVKDVGFLPGLISPATKVRFLLTLFDMVTKNKGGRPPKNLKLAPPLKAVDSDALQSMRDGIEEQEKPVLQPTRDPAPEEAGRVGIFPAADRDDPGRRTKVEPSSVPGNPGHDGQAGELKAGVLLKKVLHEKAAKRHQDSNEEMTNIEVLIRLLVGYALDGNKFALERVLDQYEGKPVRGSQVKTADTSIEDLIDQQSVALLNGLITKDPTP